MPATHRNVESEQFRFLSRAPEGTEMVLRTSDGRSVTLKATLDNYLPLRAERLVYLPPDMTPMAASAVACITCKVLDVGDCGQAAGLIQVPHFLSGCKRLRKKVARAMQTFREKSVEGIIVDLRGNVGGGENKLGYVATCMC